MSLLAPPTNQGILGRIGSEFKDIYDRHVREAAAAEEGGEVHPFAHLDKAIVLQECRVFSDAAFVKLHPKRCCHQIAKLLYFLTQGETFSGTEATEVFFGVTKLFQSPDGNLRRMVYLFLREVAQKTDPTNVIIVVQSLVKDMVHEQPLYRANAIRVLAQILDEKMLGQVERYFKQAVVDKDEHVQAAALASSYSLLQRAGAGDVIGRWAGELQTILTSGGKGDAVSFLALALLRSVRKADRLAVSKLTQTLRGSLRTPLSLLLLIRYSSSLVTAADTPPAVLASTLDFLDACLRHTSDLVMLEAARAIAALPQSAGRDLGGSIAVLDMFLASPKPALRYAAVKTLARLASTAPAAVAKCNDVLEGLIGDANRGIGTLAITTLLKTGSEANTERLVKQIASFMGEVGSDELKVTVVKAVHELALRVPSKHRPIQSFLSNALRDEGGYDFKKAVLDALLDMMEAIPEAKTEGLFHCCEFIEDCEFTALATRVLHLLGKEGPALPAPQPSGFIRFIYNRVILEAAPVRASAVSALAKFAARCEDLRPQIVPLLKRCTDDDDDEVRDRATMYLRLLGAGEESSGAVTPRSGHLAAIINGTADSAAAAAAVLGLPLGGAGAAASSASPSSVGGAAASPVDPAVARSLTSGVLPLPVSALQKALHLYQLRPSPGAFSFSSLPHVDVGSHPTEDGGGYGFMSETRAAEAATAAGKVARARARAAAGGEAGSGAAGSSASAAAGGGGGSSVSASADPSSSSSSSAEALYKIPEFASFGPLFRSSRPADLTERELEYLVSVQKHVFANHVVFGFTITNTVPEVLLERVTVAMAPSEAGYSHAVTIGVPRIREGAPGVAYVAFARDPEAGFPSCTFSAEVRFSSRECDPTSNYEPVGDATKEEYPVNDIDLGPADFVAGSPVPDFRSAWGGMGAEGEVEEEFALSFKSVAEAVTAVVDTLGLAPCEGTGAVKPSSVRHAAHMSGKFLGGIPVLARMAVALDTPAAGGAASGCTLRIAIRSPQREVSELLMAAIS